MTSIPAGCIKNVESPCLRQDRCVGHLCARITPNEGELLSVEEKDILEKLGEIHNQMKIVIGPKPEGISDLREAISHIHNLQRMVMAQAAARRYPELYRPLGNNKE